MTTYKFLFTRPDEGYWLACRDSIGSWWDASNDVAARLRNETREKLEYDARELAACKGCAVHPVTDAAVKKAITRLRDEHHFTRDQFPHPPHLVHFTNGIYNTLDRSFTWRGSGHCPDQVSERFYGDEGRTLDVIPHEFNPTATVHDDLVDELQDWLLLILGDDAQVATWWEWLGYCLTWDTSMKRAMLFHGPTNTGKTALSDLMAWLLGEGSVTQFTLTYLTTKREEAFAAMEGKRLNSDDELERVPLKHVGAFKELTSGRQHVNARPLWSTPYPARLTVKPQFNGNLLPDVHEPNEAFAARWVVLYFRHQFTGDDVVRGYINRFKQEHIASWMIWRALQAYHQLQERGTFLGQDPATVLEWWRTETDAVYRFVTQCCTADKSRPLNQCDEKGAIYDAFTEWCDDNGIDTGKRGISANMFTRRMGTLGYPVARTRDHDGTQLRVYKGIMLNEKHDEKHDVFDIDNITLQKQKTPARREIEQYRQDRLDVTFDDD